MKYLNNVQLVQKENKHRRKKNIWKKDSVDFGQLRVDFEYTDN